MNTLFSSMRRPEFMILGVALSLGGCFSEEPNGLARAPQRATTVKVDLFHRPLPEIPLPNDLATRYDPSSATGRRINASLVAPTEMEGRLRENLARVDGWGVFQPVTIPFTGPLDVSSVLAGHRDADYDPQNDVLYLINIDRGSKDFGKLTHLDLGNGNYPLTLEERGNYWEHDPHGDSLSLVFGEVDEDKNGNGELDPGEDIDADGLLDRPNYLPGKSPGAANLAGRADALMTFYERQTHTLIARPLVPLKERTRYAVVVTTRLKDTDGNAVGSPYAFINHSSQTQDLEALPEVLPKGLGMDEVAFAFSFTTQTVASGWKAVRDGLYGHGAQAHLSDEFPARVSELLPLRAAQDFPGMQNAYILYAEQFVEALGVAASQFLGQQEGTEQYRLLIETQKYVDYYVIGSFESPQLFQRTDREGKRLPWDAQIWPEDLDRKPATARKERVYFWMAVPRKEVSARGQGKPAPVVLLGHGYTGDRWQVLPLAGLFAKYGMTAVAIDHASHGMSLGDLEEKLVKGVLKQFGFGPLGESLLQGRSSDLNGDGRKDSGGDYWTSYLFHTRDMVRQSVLDHLQLVRVLRSFDGKRSWDFGIGQKIAGDFDGDGMVDVGSASKFTMVGASLGGMVATLVGAMEPEITTIVPISGGGGMGDIGLRSVQPGVPEGFLLRTFGPLYLGTLNRQDGKIAVEVVVPNLNEAARVELGTMGELSPGDTVVVENLRNGSRGCAYVDEAGAFRIAVQSNAGDPTVISAYSGAAIEGTECAVKKDAILRGKLSSFGNEGSFGGLSWAAGDALFSISEGMGLRRANPELRRFSSLASAVLDPADPAVMAAHLQKDPIHFAGQDGPKGTHALIVTTPGDMAVPTSSGVTMARAAGLVNYLDTDPRYGTPANQVLVDTYTVEGINTFQRYTDATGKGVHIDLENFSDGDDGLGADYPRLKEPLRLGMNTKDAYGGYSAALFPLADPEGQHVFAVPGEAVDKARAKCRAACTESGDDPCGCNTLRAYDASLFLLNVSGQYLLSDGKTLSSDLCNALDNCKHVPPPPASRTELK